MTPDTAYFSGSVHGGIRLKLFDQVAYPGAHVVTLNVDQVTFRKPMHVGHPITFLLP